MSDLRNLLIAEKESVWRVLTDSLGDFVCLATSHGEPFYLNLAGREMVGLGEAEPLPSTNLHDYYGPESWKELRDAGVPAVNRVGHWEGRSQLRHLKTGAPDRRADRHVSRQDAAGRQAHLPGNSASQRGFDRQPACGPGGIASPQTRHPRVGVGPHHHHRPRRHHYRVQPGCGADLWLSARQGIGDAAGGRPLSPLGQHRP